MRTIAVDLDDVISAQAEALIEFSNQKWGTHLNVDDYDEHWAKMWNLDEQQLKQRALEINNSGIFRRFKHVDEAIPVLQKLSKNYKLVIATSRQKHLQKDTLEWLDKYFGGLFTEIHFADIWDRPLHSQIRVNLTKKDLLERIEADYLIDDLPKHCIAAAEAGIEALLFGDYSWNRLDKLPQKVTRVKDWQAVGEFFTRTNFQSLNARKEI